MSIKVTNLIKTYASQNAVNNISFNIESGQVVGFLGPNGAGKSTTMKIITAFLPQTSGEVLVNGYDVINDSLKVRSLIGYLPENNPLYPDMYIREYLEFVAGIYKINNKSKRIEDVIEMTGLGKESSKKIGALSKGYKQRVGLAQAIIHDPKVLILDEPTTGLDPNQIIEIRNLIGNLGREKTVLLSTHLLQEVKAICDRVLIINNGDLVANDSTEKLQNNIDARAQVVEVSFDKGISLKLISNISGVSHVETISDKKYKITAKTNSDIRPLLMNFAIKNNLSILNMNEESKSLEQIFQELTK